MNNSRAQILRKIRQALAQSEQEFGPEGTSEKVREGFFPSVTRDVNSLIRIFQKEFEQVGGEVQVCQDVKYAIEFIGNLIEKEGFQTVAVSRHSLCLRLNLVEAIQARLPEVECLTEGIDSENPYERIRLKEQMARVPVSITGIEYLIAETGTLVAWAHPAASRQISLLPQVHIALATIDQIRPNLPEVFAEIQAKYGGSLPGSALTLITGPSRTADIEKVLIKGVHGPTRLVAVLLGNLE